MPARLRPLLIAAALVRAASGQADEIELEHGGRLRGELRRDADTPRSVLALQSPWGPITVRRSAVGRVSPVSPAQAEYRRRAPTVSDTPEAQLALANWCRDNGLGDELRVHLRRVLEFDPEHAEARRLLGHQQLNGQWVTRDELLASRGLVRHDGEYRTQQEIDLVERAATAERVRREWSERLADWRSDLTHRDPERVRAAVGRLADLADTAAGPALAAMLSDEQDAATRVLLIGAAGRLATAATLQALAAVALDADDDESRAAALEELSESGRLGLTAPFVAALGAKDNNRVNLAADGLAALGDDRTLAPLIEALTTTHRIRVAPDTPGDTYSFTPTAGQFSFGGGPSVITRELRNPRVHRALVAMTGVNFLYDKDRWRQWLADRQVTAAVDLRRDP